MKLKLITLSVIAGISSTAIAQEGTEHNESLLDTVTVVGGIAPKTISETASAVYYIDSDTVQRGAANGKTVSQIISAAAPSLNASTEARTNYAQNMRGRRVLVMIDGVSLNSSRLVSRQFDSISPFNIDHIEILSGATAVYGGNASGGIINIVTKKASAGKIHGSTSIGLTSGFNRHDDLDYTFSQSLSGGNDTIQGRVGLNLKQTKNAYDASGKGIIPDIAQGSLKHNRSIDITAGISITPDETQNIDISAQYYDNKQDRPYSYDFGPSFAGLSGKPAYADFTTISKGFKSDRQSGTKRRQFNINYSNDSVFGGQSFIGQFSHRKENLTFMPYPKPTGLNSMPIVFSASQQLTDVSTLRLAIVKDADPVKITYGISASKESFEANQMVFDPATSAKSHGLVNKKLTIIDRYPNVKILDLSAFAEIEYKLNDKLTLDGGYRFEYIKNTVDDFIAADYQAYMALGYGKTADTIKGGTNNYKVSLFNIGARYELSDTQQTWAKFSQGFELPDPAKYYGIGKYDINPSTGNWDLVDSINADKNALQGIKTNSLELGWRLDNGPFNIQLATYYSISDKAIVASKKNLNITIKDTKRRDFGIEGQGNYALNDNWDIGGQFHFSRTQQKDSDNKWKEPSIKNRSNPANAHKLGAYVAYHNDTWTARLDANTTMSLTDGAGDKYQGYTLFDASASYKIGGGKYGTINFAINNLFNKQYITTWGQQASRIYGNKYTLPKLYEYQGRGRTMAINYQFNF
ncbi:MAG: TonB-dependent receptor [Gammaproteobacteria bacterium]|nr:TonB-dependent receptor [Gammaproteobacteria bacterium]